MAVMRDGFGWLNFKLELCAQTLEAGLGDTHCSSLNSLKEGKSEFMILPS